MKSSRGEKTAAKKIEKSRALPIWSLHLHDFARSLDYSRPNYAISHALISFSASYRRAASAINS
jgi:hypothetical protein